MCHFTYSFYHSSSAIFDFLNNPNIKPIVMYMFEFEYIFDRDDLAYMWQNLAPRKSRTMTFQKSSISHNLMDLELLNEDNLMDNPNLRWMVFKVKQRAQTDYYDLVSTQVGGAEMPKKSLRKATDAGMSARNGITVSCQPGRCLFGRPEGLRQRS